MNEGVDIKGVGVYINTMNAATETNPLAVTTATYTVPAENFFVLLEKVAKLARKSAKLNLPAIELAKTGEFQVPFFRTGNHEGISHTKLDTAELLAKAEKNVAEGRGSIIYRTYFTVTLTGAVPRLAGWEFVATLQHLEVDGEVANMLRIVPGFGESLPVRFRTSGPENCDHCRKVIRSRKETFVVRKTGTNEWLQVGRSCTQTFLGGADPHSVAKGLEYLQSAGDLCNSAESDGFGGGRFVESAEMETFLAWAAACVRIDGWLSRGKARAMANGMTATADMAFMFECPPHFGPGQDKARREFEAARLAHTPTDADKALVAAALTYAETSLAGKMEGNDYLYNLWVACNQSTVTAKLAGIAGSLISHYIKEVERATLHELETRRTADSKHVGTVGERRFFKVTTLKVITVDGQFGTTCIHKMVDADGNLLVWFATGSADNLETGKEVWLKATVKKHDTRDGKLQTVINRAEVWPEELVKAEQEKLAKKAAKAAAKLAKQG